MAEDALKHLADAETVCSREQIICANQVSVSSAPPPPSVGIGGSVSPFPPPPDADRRQKENECTSVTGESVIHKTKEPSLSVPTLIANYERNLSCSSASAKPLCTDRKALPVNISPRARRKVDSVNSTGREPGSLKTDRNNISLENNNTNKEIWQAAPKSLPTDNQIHNNIERDPTRLPSPPERPRTPYNISNNSSSAASARVTKAEGDPPEHVPPDVSQPSGEGLQSMPDFPKYSMCHKTCIEHQVVGIQEMTAHGDDHVSFFVMYYGGVVGCGDAFRASTLVL
jgi:hypothetical protein